MKPSKKIIKLVNETMEVSKHTMIKLLLECWNAESPHFGGCGPHRYNGRDKECCYCNRPKDWKVSNASFLAESIAIAIEEGVK